MRIADADGAQVRGARVALGEGAGTSDRLVLDGHVLTPAVGDDLPVGDAGLRLAGGGFDPETRRIELAGETPASIYGAVPGTVRLEPGPEGGERRVTFAVSDAAGATGAPDVPVEVAAAALGSAGDDALAGTAAADRLLGGDGRDSIDGGAGADLAAGGAGDDTLRGDRGDGGGPGGGEAGRPASA